MAARTKDMTVGNPTRLILSFCLPIVAGNLFQQLYSLVDTLVIGRVEGVTALAAVSAAGWLDWFVLGLAMGMAQGFSILIAQLFGAGDHAGLRCAAGQSILLSIVISVVLTAVSEVEFAVLRERLGVSDSVLSKHVAALEAVDYLRRRKGIHRGRRTTWIALTSRGRRVLGEHVAALREIIDGVD